MSSHVQLAHTILEQALLQKSKLLECRRILYRATQQPKTLLKLYITENTWKTICENNRNTTKLWKKCDGSCLAATTVQGTHSYYTRQWAPAGTMHCAGPFRPTLLLYCTHRCCITVLNTQVLYTCKTHVIAVPLYCKHKCCTCVWKRKKQMSHKHDTPWKDKSWIYHPFTQQSSRLSHPRRVVSSKHCQYKRWQDWKTQCMLSPT